MTVPRRLATRGGTALPGTLLLAVLGCGRSPIEEWGTPPQDGEPAWGEDAWGEGAPDSTHHLCPRSSACGDVPCVDNEHAAAAMAVLLEVAQARGYADVIEPLEAEDVGQNVVLTYALRHPAFEAIDTFVAIGPAFSNIEDLVDEWGPTWLDPEVTVADREWIQEEIDRCANMHAQVCGPTASVEYDPCIHNQVDFLILVGLPPDDAEFVRAIDPVAVTPLYCSYAGPC